MCGDNDHGGSGRLHPADDPNATEPFPWAPGRVCDAHCHPTDTVASLAAIPAMGATVLTAMATRAQDQDLVAALADAQGTAAAATGQEGKVVPAFGWHPWFSHQLYDDTAADTTNQEPLATMDDKRRHLEAVLTPSPADAAVAASPEKAAAMRAALDALAAGLPAIRPLSAFVAETRQRLLRYPDALVGEIGLDKAFRVPEPAVPAPARSTEGPASALTPGGREGRRLSPFRVQPAHQQSVLRAQLRLAAALRRPVSVHGVQMHGLLFATLAATWRGHERDVPSRRQRRQIAGIEGLEDDSEEEGDDGDNTADDKPYPPSICLHSFSGPVDMLRQYLDPRIPTAVYVSFSTAVNCGTDSSCQRMAEVVAACPDDRLLVESDLHTAGPAMDAALEDIYRRVCAIKKWSLADGVARIADNYDAFVGRKAPARNKRK